MGADHPGQITEEDLISGFENIYPKRSCVFVFLNKPHKMLIPQESFFKSLKSKEVKVCL